MYMYFRQINKVLTNAPTHCSPVSYPDPPLGEEKGLVTIGHLRTQHSESSRSYITNNYVISGNIYRSDKYLQSELQKQTVESAHQFNVTIPFLEGQGMCINVRQLCMTVCDVASLTMTNVMIFLYWLVSALMNSGETSPFRDLGREGGREGERGRGREREGEEGGRRGRERGREREGGRRGKGD